MSFNKKKIIFSKKVFNLPKKSIQKIQNLFNFFSVNPDFTFNLSQLGCNFMKNLIELLILFLIPFIYMQSYLQYISIRTFFHP